MRGFAYEDGRLHADGTALTELAEALGTPLYLYSASMILHRLERLQDAFAGLSPRVRYAVKANSNGALIRLLHEAGAGFDLVSGGELLRVLRQGVPPEHLVFAGVGKQEWEIRLALRAGLGLFNVESEAELHLIRDLAGAEGIEARLALRLNPDVDARTHELITTGKKENKFGLSFDRADDLLPLIHDHPRLVLAAYHVHLGSLLLEPEPFLAAARLVMEFMDEDEGRRRGVRAYDMGGGFGIRGLFEEPMEVESLGEGMRELCAPRKLSLLLEPGRYLVGNAGLLLTRVLDRKKGVERDFLVVDGAMSDLIRPALYEAEHEILPVEEGGEPSDRLVDVVGPVCESADFLGRDRRLPPLGPGDLLAVCNAGAYGFSMASLYNSRPFIAEALTGDGPPRLIRRRMPLEDLWREEVEEPVDLGGRAGSPPFALPDPGASSGAFLRTRSGDPCRDLPV